jgi:hypothetical protein
VTDTRGIVADFTDELLERALRSLIGDLTLVSRVPGEYESTHPLEDVTVATEEESLDIVCKYSPRYVDPMTGHQRGAAYESSIYFHAFPDPDLATPTYYGTFPLGGGVDCIVLQRVPGYRIHHSVYPRALVEICANLGRFHSTGVGNVPRQHNVFNRGHFSRVFNEMVRMPGVSSKLQNLDSIVVDTLSNAPRTLIHGELYPQNVLVNDLGPVVIDWESAGVGPGVFDLAVLTQGSWDETLVDECEEVYWKARGGFIPQWARKDLAAARIMAAGLLLVHLRGKQTDGVQEEIALDTIAAQVPELRG